MGKNKGKDKVKDKGKDRGTETKRSWSNMIYVTLSFLLLLLAFLISFESPSTGYSIGDKIMSFLGLHSTTGGVLSFAIVPTVALFFLGWVLVNRFWERIRPPRLLEIIIVTVVLALLSPILYITGYNAHYKYTQGLQAIEYYPLDSTMTIKHDNGEYRVLYQLVFENHNEEKTEFRLLHGQMPYVPSPYQKGRFVYESFTDTEDGSAAPQVITLEGKEKKEFSIEYHSQEMQRRIDNDPAETVLFSIAGPGIVIGDEKTQRDFKPKLNRIDFLELADIVLE